jgi:hypothetical protein
VADGLEGAPLALCLKRAGLRVALLVGSGRCSALPEHLDPLDGLSLTQAVCSLGVARARLLWPAGQAALAKIRAEVRENRINCGFEWIDSCLYAPRTRDGAAPSLGLEAERIVLMAAQPVGSLLRDWPALAAGLETSARFMVAGPLRDSSWREGLYRRVCDGSGEFLRVDRVRHGMQVVRGGAVEPAAASGADTALSRLVSCSTIHTQAFDRQRDETIRSIDHLPCIGDIVAGVSVATALGTSAIVYATLAGLMACDTARGTRGPWHALFDPRRHLRDVSVPADVGVERQPVAVV